MTFDLLNPAMIVGLAALALPLLAHLLHKRRYDVVPWGAMQFLELGKQQRRRIRVEEWLLLLLRMALVAGVVFALMRPVTGGGFLTNLVSTENRDTVFIFDGSYSMNRQGGKKTPYENAKLAVRRLLKYARPGDTFTLLDAREFPRSANGKPTRDLERIRTALEELPAPTGTADFPAAIKIATDLLTTTSNVRRDVILLTDGQALSWHVGDERRWEATQTTRKQPSVAANIWSLDVTDRSDDSMSNFSLDQLKISRESAPVGFPVRISTTLKYTAKSGTGQRAISLEVDGQRIAGATVQSPPLQPGEDFGVEFEYRFNTAGSHLLSVVLDTDDLPGDDRADAAITVSDAIPVLLIDGDPHLDETRSETFFAAAALRGEGEKPPLVQARVLKGDKVNAAAIDEARVIVLANQARLSEQQGELLREFVSAGGGLYIALGEKVDAGNYQQTLSDLLPATLLDHEKVKSTAGDGIDGINLALPWPISDEQIDELTAARFAHRWRVQPSESAEVLVQFRSGDPLLLSQQHGGGEVLLSTVPLDTDGSTLPTKSVFVPLLHEMLFTLAGVGNTRKNLKVGEPIVHPLANIFPDDEFQLLGPSGLSDKLQVTGSGRHPLVRWDDTHLPGVYTITQTHTSRAMSGKQETTRFVVNFDRRESDMTPLTDAEIAQLATTKDITFVSSFDELEKRLFTDVSRTELWQVLLAAVLGLLCLEIWLTRRLVRGGHAVLDPTTEQ